MADEQITSSTANIPYVNFINVGSDQAAPSAGRAILYIKDGVAYVRLDTGSPVPVGGAVSLAEGQLAVGDSGGELSALALGTEGQVVTADASGFATWDDAPAGGPAGALGYTAITSMFTTASTTPVDVTSLSVTVTVGTRPIKVTLYAPNSDSGNPGYRNFFNIYDVTASAQVAQGNYVNGPSSNGVPVNTVAYLTPAAGSRTYKTQMWMDEGGGTGRLVAWASSPAFLLVEEV